MVPLVANRRPGLPGGGHRGATGDVLDGGAHSVLDAALHVALAELVDRAQGIQGGGERAGTGGEAFGFRKLGGKADAGRQSLARLDSAVGDFAVGHVVETMSRVVQGRGPGHDPRHDRVGSQLVDDVTAVGDARHRTLGRFEWRFRFIAFVFFGFGATRRRGISVAIDGIHFGEPGRIH